MSLDKWLYNFARRRTVERIALSGETLTIGDTSVSVLLTDSTGKVILCSGTAVPTGAGYAKGCIFVKTDAGSGVKALYENQGTTTVASFNIIGGVAASEITLAEGNILLGNSDGVAAALSAKTSGRILVGDGTTVASVAVSGDATLAANGALTVAANAITTSKILNNNVTSGKIATGVLQVDTVSIAKEDILTATTIKTLIAAPAAGYYIDFIEATLTFKYATAAYTDGGNLTIGWVGGAALTGLVSNANSFGAGADKIIKFVPLSTAGIAVSKETAIGLQTSAQFTDPGTAAGVADVTVAYRILPIKA